MADSTAYDLYMKNLSKVKRLTNAEQSELQRLASTTDSMRSAFASRLQQQALLIVLYVFQRMQARDRLATVEAFDMDAIQEANMAALEALPKWEPVRGTLATWLIPHIKGALLDYANTHTNGGIGSKHNKLIQVAIDEVIASEELSEAQDSPGMETSEQITLEESLTYDSEVFPNADKEILKDQIKRRAWQIPHGIYLYNVYFDGATIEEMARAEHVSAETIRKRLRSAEERLKLEVSSKVGI